MQRDGRPTVRRGFVSIAVVCLASCSGPGTAPAPIPADTAALTPSTSAPIGPPATFVGAGDIADCNTQGSELTARLLDVIGGTVFTTGDNAYPGGTAEEFRRCYSPTWGRHLARTRPTPGNHDYNVPNGAAYFGYFGANAGPYGLGYYSYDLGTWHVISLNSEIDVRPGSPQERWLREDLAANRTRCTIAYWHRPLFSSGHGAHAEIRPIWRALYDADVDVVLNGHDHYYERFAPQDPDGRIDATRGLRQFVIGTGGATIRRPAMSAANSEASGYEWGVVQFTLEPGSYRWEFVPAAGSTFRDSGTGTCH